MWVFYGFSELIALGHLLEKEKTNRWRGLRLDHLAGHRNQSKKFKEG